jgi:hypothetical protein
MLTPRLFVYLMLTKGCGVLNPRDATELESLRRLIWMTA